ncbi:thiamine-phosphate kinase [Halalkalibacillus sediminis]|uniref:Thiamine-monophosphate kinase n=1 Tax=Halalkalibacillus sediminis TaxID=2018042 RepID=A0A2I0QQC5_9BACI|nr:thiamine-phosphate kinase [Halalkalibacillus sediminis]PKR76533.1 thiamine-phosphate kinase [Halalkalibacillus sediminis]
MDEFDFIQSIKPSYYKQSSVVKGIGDDGAIIRPTFGQDLVITSDTMVENVHFSLDYMSFEDVGYRVLAANLSDVAAMGAVPRYYIVNINVPEQISNEELVLVYQGMKELADSYRVDLIGGDTVSGKEFSISITAFGSVSPELKRNRSSAEDGDIVFVTGSLGDSGYGYELLNRNEVDFNNYFVKRHVRPEPQVSFVNATEKFDRISLNDVSDGISSELNEIAQASKTNLLIEWERLPYRKELNELDEHKLDECILSFGEDFELVGTCPEKDWELLKDKCKQVGITVTNIGRVLASTKDQPSVFLHKDGERRVLQSSGYQHR